jgi:ABC-type transport system involved in multi-copper enzyme maturation permease subunit
MALLFSTFTTSTLAAIFTLSLYVIGHLSASMQEFARRLGTTTAVWLANVLYYSLPNLDRFNIKAEVVHEVPVSMARLAWSSLYGLAYVAALLVLSVVIFQRRDFK